ncbi:MAG: arylamine N-acetyltransferase [Candidatus Krumholzibacteria bacterium]|nr:arylamine N-acetyltransferase [Candidatus Krumholzibacteria bacterium]
MTKNGTGAENIFFGHFGIATGDPDLDLLTAVVAGYSQVPYENVTKIIRKFNEPDPVLRLRGPEEVMKGFVESHTGGTCFSLTWCLGAILSSAGYKCYPAMADMKRRNIHCALIVRIGGKKYLVDPGYLLGDPVELTGNPVIIPTSFGKVELRPRGAASYDLFTIAGGEKSWRYRLRTTPVSKAIFFRHWQASFALPMMNSLQLTKLTEGGHLYIRDHHLRLRRGDMKLNENIRADLENRIEAEFGIPGDITAEARRLIERMKEGWRIQKQADLVRARR